MDSSKEQIQTIKKGLPIQFFKKICTDIELTEKCLTAILKMTTNTLSLRKKEGIFSLSESEQLYRIRQIYTKALEVFQDEKEAKNWFKKPYWLLKDSIPVDLTATETGSKEVEQLLYYIKNGWVSFSIPC
jgi:putative toxin-antitoxin system antitoxin component (TIGR02293 family)